MNDSKITTRYAKALFNLALESKKLKDVKEDIDIFYNASSNIDIFKEFLNSPIIRTSKKQEVLNNLFRKEINEITLNFINLITQNKREVFLKLICLDFLTLYRNFLNIKQSEIKTAVPISSDFKRKIENLIKEVYNCEVELDQKVDESLIGGFILKIDDKQLDASISTKLKNIKKEFHSSIN